MFETASQIIRITLFLLLFLVLPRLEAAVPDSHSAKLRGLVRLPSVTVEFGFAVSTRLGFVMGEEPLDLAKLDPQERLNQLEARMAGGRPGPADYYQLYELADQTGQAAKADQAIGRAVQGFRELAEKNPGDGWFQAQLGRSLAAAGRREEGEKMLRASTATSPSDPRCWEALGNFIWAEALQVLPKNRELDFSFLANLPSDALSSESVARVRAHYAEARQCYDRAVDSSPDNLPALTSRFLFRWIAQFVVPVIYPERRPKSSGELSVSFQEAVEDLRRVADLTTNEVYAIGAAASYEVLFASQASAERIMPGQTWSRLPDSSRARIRAWMDRLEKLGESPDRVIAAGALAALGNIQFLVGADSKSAERNLRRSIQVNPQPENVWEILRSVLVFAERWGDLAAACEARLKVKPTSRGHFLLAKAYERAGRMVDAEAQVRRALELESSALIYHLGLAAIRLRLATSPEEIKAVGEQLAHLRSTRLKAAPPAEADEFHFLEALFLGLTGERDQARRTAAERAAGGPMMARFQELLGVLENGAD